MQLNLGTANSSHSAPLKTYTQHQHLARHGGRAVERPLDFVRRRQWVPVSASDEVMTRAKRGATKLLTPVQMREAKQAAQRKWDEGMAEVCVVWSRQQYIV